MAIEVFVQVQNRARKAVKEIEAMRPLVAGAGEDLEADVVEAEKLLQRINRRAAQIPPGFKPSRKRPQRIFTVASPGRYPSLAGQRLKELKPADGNVIVQDESGREHSIPKHHLAEVLE